MLDYFISSEAGSVGGFLLLLNCFWRLITGNMLIVTPGKVTLANYHNAIKHPVKNHLLKVTPLKKSPAIMNIFIKNGWMLLHQMAYNGPDHVQITKVYWRLTVSWKKFFNKSSKMFYSKVNWKHFCWILFQFTFLYKRLWLFAHDNHRHWS